MTATDRFRKQMLPWLLGIGAAVLAGGAGYGLAAMSWSGKLADANRAREVEARTHEAELRRVRDELTASGRRIVMLEADRKLHGILLELDEHNFGRAQRTLTEAADEIAGADPDARAVVTAIRETRLVVAEDVSAQRGQVLGLIRAVEDHLGLSSAGPPPELERAGANEGDQGRAPREDTPAREIPPS